MLHLSNFIKRSAALCGALLLLVALILPLIAAPRVSAAQLTERYLSLSSSAPGTATVGAAGTGGNGQRAKHTVGFKVATTGNVGSILIQYCTSPVTAVSCTTPTNMTANNLPNNSTSLATTGFSSQNFAVDKTTSNPTGCNGGTSTTRDNCVLIKRSSAASETATTAVTIAYGGTSSDYITNPSPVNYSFFARITTYSDTGYTTSVDTGSVAAATAQQITITARVPERLEFSVGVGTGSPLVPPAPTAACTPFSDSGALTLGDTNGVLSTATTYDAWSYFRVNSNTTYGTRIYYSGDTLKNGANSITAIPPSAGEGQVSVNATRQFGLAIDQNKTESGAGYSFTHLSKTVGAYDEGHGTITGGSPTAEFAFETSSITTPIEIASSTAGISCDTGAVRYIANISTDTPAGIYTTTITYIATGTY